MEQREDPHERSGDEPAADERGHEGEDHREGPPGYDLDEQAAIERLQSEQGEQAGGAG